LTQTIFNGDFLTGNLMHPEQQDDEVFITNSRPVDVHLIGWNTKRTGEQAYDRKGEQITYFVPVFVKRWEIEEALVTRPAAAEVYKRILKDQPAKKKPDRAINLD
jgi:hypothetical protein